MTGARPRPIRVFVSSTSDDLERHRKVVKDVIVSHEWTPVMMEHMGAMTEETVSACRRLVEGCDLVVLLVAWRRGWVPTKKQGGDGDASITALELSHARENDVDVLPFLADECWPGYLWDRNESDQKWLEAFREGLNQPADFFSAEEPEGSLPAFEIKVGKALLDYKQHYIEKMRARSQADAGNASSILFTRKALATGKRIPFIGCALDANAQLCSRSLAAALVEDTDPREAASLATAAEYVERACGSRDAFLAEFRDIVEGRGNAQAKVDETVFEMLAGIPHLPLIVATSWDTSLEQYFAKQGLSYAIVSHIMSSSEHALDGRILVIRDTGAFEHHLSDEFTMPDVERVIYRPMGALFAQDNLPPDLEIDTVVLTETDHLKFISRLQNQHTQIPAPFHRPFKRFPLIFLGYALDTWQYRSVMQVFRSVQIVGTSGSISAIRRPDTELERFAWQQLGARTEEQSPTDFARDVLAELPQMAAF